MGPHATIDAHERLPPARLVCAGCACRPSASEPDCGCRNVPMSTELLAIDATPMLHRMEAAWRMKAGNAHPHLRRAMTARTCGFGA
eukprot:scaffold40854_cov34-Tisochrysis_lutea.AAC.4